MNIKMSKSAMLFGLQNFEVKWEVIYGLSNCIKFRDPRWPLGVKGQGQTKNNFEVEYFENGTR